MTPLSLFMTELLQHHTGEVEIINDNARMTANQKSATLQLTRDSLHSTSNHSTTRWEMDGSNHSTEVRNSTSSLNSLSSVPTVPTRKPSNDPPHRNSDRDRSLDISSHKAEKRLQKYLGKNTSSLSPRPVAAPNRTTILSSPTARNIWQMDSNCHDKSKSANKMMNDFFSFAEPTTAPNTPEPSPTPSRKQPTGSLNHLMPSRKLSPMREESPIPPPPSTMELIRSLSKTLLGVDNVNPQAPKLPTRKPSKQPDLNSPIPPTSDQSSSTEAYSQLVSDISLSPLDEPTPVSRNRSDKSLIEQVQEVSGTLPPGPPLIKKSKRGAVFRKPSSKWLGSLAKRN